MSPPPVSRRDLISGAAVVGTTFALQDHQAAAQSLPASPAGAAVPQPISPGPNQFFSTDEASFIDAAVSRLIPNDDLGPGAKEAGVMTFIDRQLAGAFGRAETWYMRGPWAEGTKSQGYQTRLTPAQLYRAAIRAVDAYCRQSFAGKSFVQIDGEQQDRVLRGLETGTIVLSGVPAERFFEVFLQNTIEGFFSDPIYGGNRNMVGWKLIGFPGARYDYRSYVSKHGQRLNLPPVGLKGGSEWQPRS
jgi:gluconate 2-dehydrogenase gamma chain